MEPVATAPYREPPIVVRAPASPSLVYVEDGQERTLAPMRAWVQSAGAASVAASIATFAGSVALGATVFAAGITWAFARARRARSRGGIELRVAGGEIAITSRASGAELLRAPLASIRDVELDTASIERGTRDMRLSALGFETRGGAAIDVSRIVVVPRAPDEPVPLTTHRVAHLEAVEWAGKIRAFLRSHGWLPEDER